MVLAFADLPADAVAAAGGKGASLCRMSAAGLPVPPGFVVCATAFETYFEQCGGAKLARELVGTLNVSSDPALEEASRKLRGIILEHPLPSPTADAIDRCYRQLGTDALVAVRSSAVAEDSETASFAGQQETFLNVRGAGDVRQYVRECWASFFAPRALFYRATKGVLSDTRMAVVVQEMISAEKSGVLFTVDPVQKRRDRMIVEAVFGLGEGIVSGLITPDHYLVRREDLSVDYEFIAPQMMAVVRDEENGGTRNIALTKEHGCARVLSEVELQNLCEAGLRLETFFGAPQDVEWCLRGGTLSILQSRPITTL
jgi:pyruvate,water dikinase